MRFRNFGFTELLTTRVTEIKNAVSPCICAAAVVFFVYLCPQTANAQARAVNARSRQITRQIIKGYAVQVAALSSRGSAEELVRGLSARGINAYWVKGSPPGALSRENYIHRVRIGNFPTIARASAYAERLLGSGLLGDYAIAAYEAPAKVEASKAPSQKVQSFAQTSQERQFKADPIDMITAVGTRGWLLLSAKSMSLTVQQGGSELSRELANLTSSLNSRGWSPNNDIAKLLAVPKSSVIAAANTRGWSLNNDIAKLLSVPEATNIASANSGIVPNTPGASNAPAAFVSNNPAPSPVAADSGSFNASAPGISRAEVVPAYTAAIPVASSGPPASSAPPPIARNTGSRIFTPQPKLQGSIEMRGGRMWMTLRNTDLSRSFSGVARITLSNDKSQQDVTPMQFTLEPDKEASFPVDEATVKNGDWILMVYDQNGTARLIRGASLPMPAPPQAPGAPNPPAAASNANVVAQNPAPQGPPSYVTGVFDATGWVAPPPQSPEQIAAQQNTPAPDTANTANTPSAQDSNPQPPPQPEPPPQVTVTPRQLAVTTENVTLEFELLSQSPLGYVVVTLRAGDFQDVRQALVSTPQGRVPFLVPSEHTKGAFSFDVRDDAQRVLASGSGDFRSIAKGN